MQSNCLNHNYRHLSSQELVTKLRNGELLVVNPHDKNGLIIYKSYYAEFAGPGAAVGGIFDLNVIEVLQVGDISLIYPQESKEKLSAYGIRREWIRLIKQITDQPSPSDRAQQIINQFQFWFEPQIAIDLPDEAFARLVGVFPQTVRKIRHLLPAN